MAMHQLTLKKNSDSVNNCIFLAGGRLPPSWDAIATPIGAPVVQLIVSNGNPVGGI